jgi:hypothetical protein
MRPERGQLTVFSTFFVPLEQVFLQSSVAKYAFVLVERQPTVFTQAVLRRRVVVWIEGEAAARMIRPARDFRSTHEKQLV